MLRPTARFVSQTLESLETFARQLQHGYCYEIDWPNKNSFVATNGLSVFEGILHPYRFSIIEDDMQVRLSELHVPIHRKYFQQLLERVKELTFCHTQDGKIIVDLPRKFLLVLTEAERENTPTQKPPGYFLADHTVLNLTVHEICEFEYKMEQLFGVGCINRFSVGEGLGSLDFSLFYFHRLGLDYMLGALQSNSLSLMNHQGIRVMSDWQRYLYYTRRVSAVFGLEQRDG